MKAPPPVEIVQRCLALPVAAACERQPPGMRVEIDGICATPGSKTFASMPDKYGFFIEAVQTRQNSEAQNKVFCRTLYYTKQV